MSLDLNGFVIEGPADACRRRVVPVWCTDIVGGTGVSVAGDNVAVMNGTIRAMAGAGVSISNGRVERLTVSDNRRAILVRYTGSVTTDETFRNGGLVVGNRISGNAGEGISCVACTVIGNTVLNNGSVGLFAEAVAYGENLFWGNNSNGTQVELHEHSASGSSRQTAANSCNGSPCPD